jgi:DNA-binding NtrC family response regulator
MASRCDLGLVGSSPVMETLRETIRRVSRSDRPVLVLGPTGSGKELVVRAIHAQGDHPGAPLIDVNCGAIPEPLMESFLFGHERGAFTGATRRQDGALAQVGQGTLFLDEIAELPLNLQTKLLRALETRRFVPVGSTAVKQFEGRVVAATHAPLQRRVAANLFREDLFYRLDVLTVRVPPLADRVEDIPALVLHFCDQQPRPLRLSPAAVDLLCALPWPGNVRQLRNVIDRLAVFSDGEVVSPEALRLALEASGATSDDDAPALGALVEAVLRLPAEDKLQAAVDAIVAHAVDLAGGNKSAAARLLGVHRKVIERRLRC